MLSHLSLLQKPPEMPDNTPDAPEKGTKDTTYQCSHESADETNTPRPNNSDKTKTTSDSDERKGAKMDQILDPSNETEGFTSTSG